MLVLSRKRSERIVLKVGEHIVRLTVCDALPGRVRLGFDAPPEVSIQRQEIADAIAREQTLTRIAFQSSEREPVLLGIAE